MLSYRFARRDGKLSVLDSQWEGRSRCQKTEMIFKKAVFRPGQSFATICNLPILGRAPADELGRQTFSLGNTVRAREEIRSGVR